MAPYPSFLTMLAFLPGGQDHSTHHLNLATHRYVSSLL